MDNVDNPTDGARDVSFTVEIYFCPVGYPKFTVKLKSYLIRHNLLQRGRIPLSNDERQNGWRLSKSDG